jgi:hypothetical protein
VKTSLSVYPFRTMYYQEGHFMDGVGELFLCTKPYAPTSHPMLVMVERTPRIYVVVTFQGGDSGPCGLETLT